MKNKNSKITTETGSITQNPASLPGYVADSKKAKESKFIKHRAIVFDRQMSDNYEIIF